MSLGTLCGRVFSVRTLSDVLTANTSKLRGHCDTSLPASWSSDSTSWTPGPSGAQDQECVSLKLPRVSVPGSLSSSRGTVSKGRCQSPGAGRAARLLPCAAHHPYPGPLPGSRPRPCPQLSAWQGLWGSSSGACRGLELDGGGRLSRSQSSGERVAIRSGDKGAAHPCRLGLTWEAPCYVTQHPPHHLRRTCRRTESRHSH